MLKSLASGSDIDVSKLFFGSKISQFAGFVPTSSQLQATKLICLFLQEEK